MNKFFAQVYDFNKLAGRFDNEGYNKDELLHQVKLIREEVNELEDAIELANHVNILKEWTDVMVTATGFGFMLEHVGYNCHNSLEETGANNLTKFPTDFETVEKSVQMYKDKGIGVVANKVENRWVIRDTAGKVRKPYGYENADVTKYSISSEEFFDRIKGFGV